MNATKGELNRRDFLGAAATLGGGLVLALSLPGCTRKPGFPDSGATGQMNAWLRIAADNTITFIVDRSEMGQGVYTALPMLIAEELEVGLEAVKIVAAPVGDAYINPGNGGQVTGTSNSVQDAWVKLRTAGAQARNMLINAAAEVWGVDPGECAARKGVVTSRSGKSATYGELALHASRLPVPANVSLKPAKDFELIGRGLPRTDTPAKVDGSAEFGIDVRLPGMLYAAFAQCPVLGGTPKAVDSAAAQKIPGVRKVLKTDRGVVVVADHFWTALKGRDALKVTWDHGANATLDNAAIAALLRDAESSPGLSARADGDADQALKNAKTHISVVYELPLLAHATMEPMNCTADVKADRCDLYVGTQVQKIAQSTAAAAAGLRETQVDVHTTLLGGGFGRRLDVDFIPAAVEASKAVGRPVQLIWTREDDMTHDTYRPPALERISAGFDASSALVAWKLHIVSPSITARMFPPVKGVDDSVIEAAKNFPYDVPNVSVTYTRQEVGIDVGYMRSVSHAINCFVIESFMDELAAEAGKNPLDFRRSLLGKKPRHRRVLDEAAARAGWGKAPAGHFQGVALMEGYTTHLAQVAEVSVEGGELKIHKIVCVVDCGRMVNPRIVESQIEGGIVFGLTETLWGDVTISNGAVRQTNFDGYRVLRLHEMPKIEVHLLPSDEPPGGIGEPAVALVAPAVCNALYAATGRRLRTLPLAAAKPPLIRT